MTRIYPAFKYLALIIFLLGTLVPSSEILGQKAKSEKEVKTATPKPIKTGFDTVGLSGLKFRSIGPALTSGRISEIAVDPLNPVSYTHLDVYKRQKYFQVMALSILSMAVAAGIYLTLLGGQMDFLNR